jgi:hypothetical protein
MRLLLLNNSGQFNFPEDFVGDDTIPPYAILSHTWGTNAEEINFEDITNGTGKDKTGYEKIHFCGEQARQDGLQHFWVDTCCTIQTHHRYLCPTKRVAFVAIFGGRMNIAFHYKVILFYYSVTFSSAYPRATLRFRILQ